MSKKYLLKLYIAGIAPDNQDMILDLKSELTEHLGNNFTLNVIDVLEHPNLAEEERILATPTVVRLMPEPTKKIIVSITDHIHSVIGMDLIVKEE